MKKEDILTNFLVTVMFFLALLFITPINMENVLGLAATSIVVFGLSLTCN